MKGKIYCIGTGPGKDDLISERALKAIEKSDVIAGYGVYTDLIAHLIKDKELIVTPMKQEKSRCEKALEKAEEGKTVSLISSGDAGVYGMAGLLIETAEKSDVEVEPPTTTRTIWWYGWKQMRPWSARTCRGLQRR